MSINKLLPLVFIDREAKKAGLKFNDLDALTKISVVAPGSFKMDSQVSTILTAKNGLSKTIADRDLSNVRREIPKYRKKLADVTQQKDDALSELEESEERFNETKEQLETKLEEIQTLRQQLEEYQDFFHSARRDLEKPLPALGDILFMLAESFLNEKELYDLKQKLIDLDKTHEEFIKKQMESFRTWYNY